MKYLTFILLVCCFVSCNDRSKSRELVSKGWVKNLLPNEDSTYIKIYNVTVTKDSSQITYRDTTIISRDDDPSLYYYPNSGGIGVLPVDPNGGIGIGF